MLKNFCVFGLLFVDAVVVVVAAAAWVPQLKPVCLLLLCTFIFIYQLLSAKCLDN